VGQLGGPMNDGPMNDGPMNDGPGDPGGPAGMQPPPGFAPGGGPSSGGPFGGGPDGAQQDTSDLVAWLTSHQPGSRYLVAVSGRASGGLLTSGTPGVMAMGGGFDGSDPTPTAKDLAALVASGELRYVIAGQEGQAGRGGPGGGGGLGSSVGTERSAWITVNCTPVAGAPTTLGTVSDCGTPAG